MCGGEGSYRMFKKLIKPGVAEYIGELSVASPLWQ